MVVLLAIQKNFALKLDYISLWISMFIFNFIVNVPRGHITLSTFYAWFTDSRCKWKQDSVGVRRILVVPRDSGGASTGFCWCILSDKRSRYWHSWSFCGKCYD